MNPRDILNPSLLLTQVEVEKLFSSLWVPAGSTLQEGIVLESPGEKQSLFTTELMKQILTDIGIGNFLSCWR